MVNVGKTKRITFPMSLCEISIGGDNPMLFEQHHVSSDEGSLNIMSIAASFQLRAMHHNAINNSFPTSLFFQ